MRLFKTADGTEWKVDITVATVRRVRTLTEGRMLTDLAAHDSDLTKAAATDALLIPDLLYAVCKPQADTAGITDEQFGELLAGDVLEQAAEALIQGVLDFFPNARRRAVTRKILGKSREVIELASADVISKLDAITPRAALDALAKPSTSSPPATSTPASSVSTPTT